MDATKNSTGLNAAVVVAGVCGYKSLRVRVVAVSSVIKRFVWLVQRFKIVAFARYLWLVDYKILQRFNNKLPILTYYNIIKI